MELEMNSLATLINQRRSVRSFLPDAVPDEVLRSIFEIAQRAPSNCNVQPWHAFVVSGEVSDRLREALWAEADAEVPPNPDFGDAPVYEGPYRKRQVECAVTMYDTIQVSRDDKAGRKKAMLRNFQFFGAPHAVFIGMPRGFGVLNAVDIGIYLQTLMLVMSDYGVSSCAQGALNLYPDVVRDLLGSDENMGILVGVSFGYEDKRHTVNKAITDREDIAEP